MMSTDSRYYVCNVTNMTSTYMKNHMRFEVVVDAVMNTLVAQLDFFSVKTQNFPCDLICLSLSLCVRPG